MWVIPLVQKKKWKYLINHEISNLFKKSEKECTLSTNILSALFVKMNVYIYIKKKNQLNSETLRMLQCTVNDSSQYYRSSPSNQSSSSDPGPSGSSQWRQQVGYDGYWFYFSNLSASPMHLLSETNFMWMFHIVDLFEKSISKLLRLLRFPVF